MLGSQVPGIRAGPLWRSADHTEPKGFPEREGTQKWGQTLSLSSLEKGSCCHLRSETRGKSRLWVGEGGAGSGQAASEIPLWYPTVITGKAGDTNVGNVHTQLSPGGKDTEHGEQGSAVPGLTLWLRFKQEKRNKKEPPRRRAGQ